MVVKRQDLINYGLFDTLPEDYKSMKGSQCFVFYYVVLEEQLKLKIFDSLLLPTEAINFSLYRGLREKMYKYKENLSIGFFSNSVESRDGLYFQFLMAYNDSKSVYKFLDYCIEQDKVGILNIATNSNNEINGRSDFERIIGYFSQNNIQPLMQIFDMVNQAFKMRLSYSLYSKIKRVVNIIKFDGGVLAEENGYLRFMVIGENANLSAEQADNLKQAKSLLRSGELRVDDIYLITGWCFNDKDGKWRTNISDDEVSLLGANLYDYYGRKLYIPIGSNEEQMQVIIQNPQSIYSLNYRGCVSDVLNHPSLYDYYPELSTVPLIYYCGGKPIKNLDGSSVNIYCYTENERGGYIKMIGSEDVKNTLSILLHEIQHYIQNVEGFATGGNQFFATFVASIGSESVRKVFSCINRMQRHFAENFLTDEKRIELKSLITKERASNADELSLKKTILSYLDNYENYIINYKTLNFYLIIFVATKGSVSLSNIVDYMQENIGDFILELFHNVTEGYSESRKHRDILAEQNYKDEDITNILFKGYENLYGEVESRSVQESRLVPSEYKNYFYLSRWENAPLQKITVIDGIENILDITDIKAAVETVNNGDYIFHFQRGNSAEPFLHELGHILYDALIKLGHKDIIEEEFSKDYNYTDADEYFVSQWLAYLQEKIHNKNVISDIKRSKNLTLNSSIEICLDDFFAPSEYSARFEYIQTILEICQ